MPKRLGDINSLIILKGRELLFKEGYSALSMRRLASELGISVGSIYNYVKDKDDIVALISLNDWQKTAEYISIQINNTQDLYDGLMEIFRGIRLYRSKYIDYWMNLSSKMNSSKQSVSDYHPFFVGEVKRLAEPVFKEIDNNGIKDILCELIISCAIHKDISESDFKAFIKMIDIGGQNEQL